jgi:hypothetical protein
MRYKDIFETEIIDEALSSADLSRLEKWVRKSFSNRGMKVNFSDHLMDRLDDRTDVSIGDIERVFAHMILSDSIKKAFEVLSDKKTITQTHRVIDFKLDGKLGSFLIVKNGKNNYAVDTFYLNGLLTNGARTSQQKYAMFHNTDPERETLCPTYSIGEVPKEDVLTMIRRSREQNIPGENTNIHGYDGTRGLANRQSTRVFTVVNAHTMMVIDALRKSLIDVKKGKVEPSKPTRLSNELMKITTLFANNLLIDRDDTKEIVSMINSLSIRSSFGIINNNSKELKNYFSKAINIIRNEWNINKDILKAANYLIKNNQDLRNKTSGQLLDFINKNPNIKNDGNFSASEFIKQVKTSEELSRNPELSATIKKYSNILTLFLDIASQLEVTTRSLSGKELTPTDIEQASSINSDTGKLKSAASRNSMTRRSRDAYNRETGQQISSNINRYIDGLLSQQQTDNSIEQEIRELLDSAKNPNDYSTAIQMIGDIIKTDTAPSPFTQMVARYLPVLKRAIITNETIEEDSMNNMKKYVDMLIADFYEPKTKQWDSEEDDISVDEYNKKFDPSNSIPQEFRHKAKEQAFKHIIDAIKKDPNLLDHMMNNDIPWIPQSIKEKMVSIKDELDNLQTKHVEKSHKEKFDKFDDELGRISSLAKY